MGWKFRKSINLGGGFRINFSKSGVGYSWGRKGYRVTKTAKGKIRTTITIPGTGISYSKEVKAQNAPHLYTQKGNTPKKWNAKTKIFLLIPVFVLVFTAALSAAGVKKNSSIHDLITVISEMDPIVLVALLALIAGFACIARYFVVGEKDEQEDLLDETAFGDEDKILLCPNCGQPYEGYYCASCGTKTDPKSDSSVFHSSK